MIIDRIVMKNFKRFRQQEIRFRDGITGILGNNGTGKSSIVEAVFFALYGVQATGLPSDYIVSSFAGQKEKCEVRLDFRVGGDEYTVLRSFKKGKSVQHDASFYRAGKLRATGVSQVEAEVKRTLGMGPVDFRNTVYAAQKDLLTLLEHTSGKRKEWFLRALGIDYLKTESDSLLKERVDAKERELRLREGELKGLTDRHDPGARPEMENAMKDSKARLQDLSRQAEDHAAGRRQVARLLQEFSEKKTEHTRLVERHLALITEVSGLSRQRDQISTRIAAIAGQEQEYHMLERDLEHLDPKKERLTGLRAQKSEVDRLISEIKFIEQEQSAIEGRIAKERKKIDSLERDSARLSALQGSIRELFKIGPEIPDSALEHAIASREADLQHSIGTVSARLDHIVSERKKLVTDWNTIENAGPDGICPLCRQTLGAHFGRIGDEFSHRLEVIEEEGLSLYGEQERLAEEKGLITQQRPALLEIRTITERLKGREAVEADLCELLSQAKAKGSALGSLKTRIRETGFNESVYMAAEKEVFELERLQARFIDVGKEIGRARALKEQVKDLDILITKKRGDIAALKASIDKSGFNPDTGTHLERDLAGIDSAIRAADAEIARVTERLRNIEENIERNRKEESAISGLKGKISALSEEIALLRLTRSLIGEYVLYLMQVVRIRIEGEVSRVLAEITGGRYEQVLLDEDFNLLVRDIDDDYPLERFSGGEQDDIAVALRIALSRYLAELHQVHESNLLILDEIFGSQDEERRNNLLSALRTQESRFPQIILISHIPDIQGEFANTLMVEMGNDLSSRVQEVT